MLGKLALSGAILAAAAAAIAGLLALRLTQPPPRALGLDADGRFADLDARRNWVASDSDDPAHALHPLPGDWAAVVAAARALPRSRVVREGPGYLHLTCRSRVFGFVDDLELHHRGDHTAVRAAARAGSSDLDVNRRRVERLRVALDADAAGAP